jgi:acylphosphatase
MTSRQIRVQGRVQGVGFRYALRDQAERLGITGWVRNRSDGSVQALLQGEQAAIDRLLAWARRGPPGARVAALEEEPLEGDCERPYTRFEIRPTD